MDVIIEKTTLQIQGGGATGETFRIPYYTPHLLGPEGLRGVWPTAGKTAGTRPPHADYQTSGRRGKFAL